MVESLDETIKWEIMDGLKEGQWFSLWDYFRLYGFKISEPKKDKFIPPVTFLDRQLEEPHTGVKMILKDGKRLYVPILNYNRYIEPIGISSSLSEQIKYWQDEYTRVWDRIGIIVHKETKKENE